MGRWVEQLVAEIPGLTSEIILKTVDFGGGRAIGIPSVAVECVDIRRNTSGEGGLLDCN